MYVKGGCRWRDTFIYGIKVTFGWDLVAAPLSPSGSIVITTREIGVLISVCKHTLYMYTTG